MGSSFILMICSWTRPGCRRTSSISALEASAQNKGRSTINPIAPMGTIHGFVPIPATGGPSMPAGISSAHRCACRGPGFYSQLISFKFNCPAPIKCLGYRVIAFPTWPPSGSSRPKAQGPIPSTGVASIYSSALQARRYHWCYHSHPLRGPMTPHPDDSHWSWLPTSAFSPLSEVEVSAIMKEDTPRLNGPAAHSMAQSCFHSSSTKLCLLVPTLGSPGIHLSP